MNTENCYSVLSQPGVCADGRSECSKAFQAAIDEAQRQGKVLYIPQGVYIVSHTLRLPSDFSLIAHPNARVKLDGERRKHRGDYLLTNADPENGNCNISITGGVWDGNNQGPGNAKPEDIFEENAYSGAALNFAGVDGLILRDLIVANSVTYNIRICRTEHFTIENIGFLSDVPAHNQDGIHFNGHVRHGVVRNIRALSKGQTNDDLIAFNADDSMERCENVGMVRGPIEDVLVEDIFAEDCHTILRFLSTEAPIRNVTVRNIYGGYRCYAINIDGARYCRTPLFREDEFPEGCGLMENVLIERMTCFETMANDRPAICLESRAKNFAVRGFDLLPSTGSARKNCALMARNIIDAHIVADGVEHVVSTKKDVLEIEDFRNLTVN